MSSPVALAAAAIAGGTGADGLALVFQGIGPTALGANGGTIGFQNIGSSVGALFRTYAFNVVQVGTDGAFNGNSAGASLRGTHDVTVDYVTSTQLFSILLDGATVVTQPGIALADLVGPEAYVGFTAGTGGGTDQQQINSFSFTTVYAGAGVVTPEPATLALTAAGVLALAGAGRRRA